VITRFQIINSLIFSGCYTDECHPERMGGLGKRRGKTDLWECGLIIATKGLSRSLQVVSAGQIWIWSWRLKGIAMLLKCKLQNCLCRNSLQSSFSPVLSSPSDRAPHMLPLGCVLSLIDWHISKANFSCYSAKIFLLLNFSPSLLVMPPVRLPELLLPCYGFIDLGSVQAIFNWLNLLLAMPLLGMAQGWAHFFWLPLIHGAGREECSGRIALSYKIPPILKALTEHHNQAIVSILIYNFVLNCLACCCR